MELNERKLAILKAIVEDYIATAEPVGSRTLSRKYIPSLSSATIRNEMSDLEEMGYLLQPHTSAGRIPSETAYRLYVDQLMEQQPLSPEEINQIRQQAWRKDEQMQTIIRQTAYIISELTQYTALVLAPQLRRATLKRIQLVYLSAGMALVVIVTDTTVVKDSILPIPEGITEEDLTRISRLLTERFAGHSLTDIDLQTVEALQKDLYRNRVFFDSLIRALNDSILKPDRGRLVLDGAVNIFHYPEYKDIDKARHFLTMLETRDQLYRMLAKRTKWEYTITIGDENQERELRDYSVVTATYKVGSRPVGSIGVIGPMRMNYPRVVQVLSEATQSLGEIFSEKNHNIEHRNGKGEQNEKA